VTEQKPPAMRGLARVTFRANADTVRAELEQGWTARAIFLRHHAKLGTMSYRQFVRHIVQELGHDFRPSAKARSAPPGDPPAPPLAPRVIPEASPLPSQGFPSAGHQPSRTFNYDPIERPGDRRRLLGEE
jgi:hypothetical protein